MSADIYSYFKKKTREKNIKIKDIVDKSGVSRTTVYRMIKGVVKPSEEVYNTIVEVLDLNKDEIDEFNKYIDLIDFSCTELRARQAISELLYSDPYIYEDDASFEMIVYKDNNRYVKNFNEIINEILSNKNKKDFNFDFKIINCIDHRIVYMLKYISNELNSEQFESENIHIEHLIGFHRDLYDKNIKILDIISNMLNYKSYNVFFQKENITTHTSDSSIENKNVILGTYSYIEDGEKTSKSFVVIFNQNDYSDCLIINDLDTFNFFQNLFKKTKESFKSAIYEGDDFYEFNFLLSEFEKDSEICSFNSGPVYRRVPFEIYEEFMKKGNNYSDDLLKSYEDNKVAQDYTIHANYKDFIEEVKIGNNLSKFNKITDIFTINTLTKFALFGVLNNQPPGIDSFSIEDRIEILESILQKDKDKKEQYEYFIVDRPLKFEKLSFTSSDNKLLIENIYPKLVPNPCNYKICLIEDESISKSFLDFAENYLPRNLALNKKKAEKFLLELIMNLKHSLDIA